MTKIKKRTRAMMEEFEPRRLMSITGVTVAPSVEDPNEGESVTLNVEPTCSSGDSIYSYDIAWAGGYCRGLTPATLASSGVLTHFFPSAGPGAEFDIPSVPQGTDLRDDIWTGTLATVSNVCTESNTTNGYTMLPVSIHAQSMLGDNFYSTTWLRVNDVPSQVTIPDHVDSYTDTDAIVGFVLTDVDPSDRAKHFDVFWDHEITPTRVEARAYQLLGELDGLTNLVKPFNVAGTHYVKWEVTTNGDMTVVFEDTTGIITTAPAYRIERGYADSNYSDLQTSQFDGNSAFVYGRLLYHDTLLTDGAVRVWVSASEQDSNGAGLDDPILMDDTYTPINPGYPIYVRMKSADGGWVHPGQYNFQFVISTQNEYQSYITVHLDRYGYDETCIPVTWELTLNAE